MTGILPNRRRAGLVFTALLLLTAALAVSLPSPGFAQTSDEAPTLKIRTNRDGHRAVTAVWTATPLAQVQQYQVQYRAVGGTDADWQDHDLTAAGALTENRYRGIYTVIDGLYAATEYELQWRIGTGPWGIASNGSVATEARANSPARIKSVASDFRVDENAEPGALVESGWLGNTALIWGHTGRDSDYSQNEMTYRLENIPCETPGASKFAVQQWGFQGQDAYITATESLDYEAASSYTLLLTLSDGRDANGAKDMSVDASRVITIHVNDVAVESPSGPGAGSNLPPPTEKPGEVQNAAATVCGDHSLTITWGSPVDGGRAESYEVRYRPAGGSKVWTTFYQGTDASVEITGLTSGQRYLVRVFAVNERGTSRAATLRAVPR